MRNRQLACDRHAVINAAPGRVLDAGYMPGPGALDFHLSRSGDGRLVGTFLGFPRLPALFDEQRNDCYRRYAIDPPPTRRKKLDQQPDYDDAGQIAARDRLDSIHAERPAADLVGNPHLRLGETPHDGDRQHRDGKPWRREFLAPAHPQAVSRTDNDVGGAAEQQHTTDSARPALYTLGEIRASTHLDIEPPEQNTSRREFDQAVRAEGDEREAT